MKYLNIILSALFPALAVPLMAQGLVINEMQVANIDRYLDPSCNYGSWFELYNPTSEDITLTGYIVRHTDADGVVTTKSLTDNHGTVRAKGYKVLWCDHVLGTGTYDGALGKYNYTNADGTVVTLGNSALQMPFKLDTDGGTLEILTSNNVILASQTYTSAVCIARCSWARTTDGGTDWGMTATPTPGRTNNEVAYAVKRIDAPVVKYDGNIFETSVSCQVTIPDGQTLKYTTDGSTPSVNNGAISTDGSFSFTETTILRLALFEAECLPSQVVTCSFIQKNKDYYLPIVSIATDNKNVKDDTIGILCRGINGVTGHGASVNCNWNMEWERPVNVEYFIPHSGTNAYETVLNQEAEIEVSGGWNRRRGGINGWAISSSLKLKSGKVFENKNNFKFQIFDSKKYNLYKDILLRAGGDDGTARITDGLVHELIRRSGFYVNLQAYQPSHVFINGIYYGMLNIRDVTNKQYGFSEYGIDTDVMDQFEINTEHGYEQKVGDNVAFQELLILSRDLKSNPEDSQLLEEIGNLLDLDEFCNYMAAECYIGNTDWLTNNNNVKAFRGRETKGKFHFVLFDTDHAWRSTNMLSSIRNLSGARTVWEDSYGRYYVSEIFFNLLQNQSFKRQFIDAYCLMAGSIMEPNTAQEIISNMANFTNTALGFEGRSSISTASSFYTKMSDNEARTDRLNTLISCLNISNQYSEIKIRSNINSAKFLLNGQEIPNNKFNGTLFEPITLTAKAPAGYTFLGWVMNTHTGSRKADAPAKVSSLRKSSGKGNSSEASGTTESYEGNSEISMFDEIASTSETYTLTDEYEAGTFVLEAVYHKITDDEARLVAGATPIRINEVSAGNDIYINDYFKKNDWVELYNTTDEAIDIAGLYLSDDRSNPRKYQIQAMTTDPSSLPTPQTTVIPAHGTRIIWCDGLTQQNQLHAPFKLSNADGAVVSIMASDGSWQDLMEYKYQPRFCTYGRYPDGGNYTCLMSRPTIDAANSILTQDFRAATEKKWASPDISVTLGLFKGWNWTSHNLADAVNVFRFENNALCIRDQTNETIKDEVFGWVGNITTLKPAVGYKIKMNENTAITLRGNIFDKANTPVTVLKGWNWIGMPLYSPCTLTSFFCNYEATEGDCIQGQEGFATYSGGAWSGSLTELTPGQAYLLKAGKAQQFNWPPVKDGNGTTEGYSETDIDWSNAVTSFSATTESGSSSSNQSTDNAPQMTEQYASGNMDWNTSEKTSRKETNRRYMCPLAVSESAGLWTCDIHAYPNVMSLIGELKVDDRLVSDSYTVAAFCGDECRGVAEVTDGKIYMNLHGDGGEDLTFKVCDNIGEQYPLDNAMTFTTQTLVGSMNTPYLFSLSAVMGLSDADAMTIVNVEYFTLDGIRISAPGNGIYIKRITYRDGHVENVKTM